VITKSAMGMVHNPIQHYKTKHIENDSQFIKDNLDKGLVVTTHVPTRFPIEDISLKGFLRADSRIL